MKKFLRTLMLAALMVPLASNAQTQYLTVADSTATNSYVPVHGSYMDDPLGCQIVYPASMLTDMVGESILSMQYFVSSGSSNSWGSNKPMLVKMMIVPDSTLTSGYVDVTNATTVYNGTISAGDATVEHGMTVELTAPFMYTGGNLLVSYQINPNDVSGYSSISWYGKNRSGASRSGYGSSNYNFTAGVGTNRNFLPKTKFAYGEPPTCFKVQGLTVSATTSNSMTLTWSDTVNTNATYSIYNMADTTLVVGGLTDMTYTVSDLNASSVYTFGIVTDCGGGDTAEGYALVSGRTQCGPVALPFSENFNASLSSDPCWRGAEVLYTDSVTVNMGNNNKWTHMSSVSNGIAPGHYRVNIYGSSCTKWMITPQIDLSEATNPLLTFDAVFTVFSGSSAATGFQNNTSQAFKVLVSTDDGASWSVASDVSLANIADTAYHTQMVTLAPWVGDTVRVAFYAQSTMSGGDNNLHLDNILVEEFTGTICFPVSSPAVSYVTTDSAIVSWAGSADSYNVYFINGTDTTFVDNVAEDSVVLTDLTPMTAYTVGIRALCGSDSSSLVTITFRTACSEMTLPFTEDFENGVDCWTQVAAGQYTGVYSASPYSGSRAFRFGYDNHHQYLISPEIAEHDGGVMLRFMYKTYSEDYPESFVVGYSTTTNDTAAFTWGTEQTNLTNTAYTSYTEYMPENVKYVCIKYTAYDQYYLYVDSAVFSPIASDFCYPVSGLTVENTLTTSSSVTLSWASQNQTVTILDMSDSSVVASNIADTSYTITNLEGLTTYTFGVVVNCSNENSDTMTISATTACSGDVCNITIVGTDGYGDGWDYSYINLVQNGVSLAHCTVIGNPYAEEEPVTETYTYSVCSIAPIDFYWVNGGGSYDSEASFDIKNGAGEVVYSASSASSLRLDSSFFTLANACPSCTAPEVTVDSATANAITISWVSEAASFDVYNGTTLVQAGVTANTYTFTGLTASTNYTLGVMAICSSEDSSNMATVNVRTDCVGGSCMITINATDSYGDGWIGSTQYSEIAISQNGEVVATYSLSNGYSGSTQVTVCSGTPVSFSWTSRSNYDEEVGFTIVDGAGSTVYTVADASTLTSDNVFFTLASACPSCIMPVVTLDAVTETTATISWTGTAASYDVYNGTTLVQAGVTANTYTFTGLTDGTAYTFGVMAICSTEDSSSMATIVAMTECTAVTALPYREGFEDGLGCWSTVNGSADGMPWFTTASNNSFTAHGGNSMAISVSYYSDAVYADAWLVSPQISLPATTDSLTLSWWFMVHGSYPAEHYQVRVSTTTSDTASFTTQLFDIVPTATNGDWTQQTVDLSAYAGQNIYVAFHHFDSYDNDYLLVDDIEIYQGAYVAPDPDTLTVTFAVANAAMGTTNPAPGTYQYITGDTVRVSAVPNPGYHFTGWTVAMGTTTQTLGDEYVSVSFEANTFMSYGNMTFTANFEAGNPDSTTITYAVNDATMGTITPAPGTYPIYVGNSIEASATANSGYELSAWVLDIYLDTTLFNSDTITSADDDFANPMNFGTLPQNFVDAGATITITALFEASTTPQPTQYTVTLASADATMGTVSPAGASTVNEGSSFTATATPATGYHFVAWMNGTEQVSTANPYTFSVTGDIALTATFEANPPDVTYYSVSVSSANDQMGTVSTSVATGQVAENTEMTVTATAAEGYHFVHWADAAGTVVSTANPYTFTVTADVTLVAVFEANGPQGIDDVETIDFSVYSADSRVIVKGVENQNVYVYDVNGRLVSKQAHAAETVEFTVSNTGVYLVKVGNAPAKRVVVVR